MSSNIVLSQHSKFAHELLEALGLKDKGVTSLKLTFRMDEVAEVSVEMRKLDDDAATTVVKRYKINAEPIEVSDDDASADR